MSAASRAREQLDLAGLQRKPMIGFRAGRRRHRLGGVETVHPLGLLGTAARRELRARSGGRRAAAEKIGIERDDHGGAIDVVVRRRRHCQRRAAPPRARSSRLPGSHWCHSPMGSARALLDLRGQRRRADRSVRMRRPAPLQRLRASRPRASRRETPTTGGFRQVASASAADRGRTDRGARPARTRRSRRGWPGCSGLPSTLVGRPSWLSTRRPVRDAAERHRGRVKQRLARERCLRAAARRGRSVSGGWRVQPAMPASASEAPISFRNVRRSTGSAIASI